MTFDVFEDLFYDECRVIDQKRSQNKSKALQTDVCSFAVLGGLFHCTSVGVNVAANYSIGHKALDDDHDRMIAAWRELEASRTLDAAKAAGARLMAEAKEHFDREEQVMVQCGYPDLARHKRLHAEMGSALRHVLLLPLLGKCEHQDFILAMRSLMDKWVMAHILGEDAKLAPYARAHAATARRPAMAAARR